MNKLQTQVREFMLKAGQECPAKPTWPSGAVRELRLAIIAEELCELADAFGCVLTITYNKDGVRKILATAMQEMNDDVALDLAADATADLRYVVTGTDVAMGIDGEPIDAEVHRSNMSKFIDGHRREDGKWIKGPSYSPANLVPIIEAQLIPDSELPTVEQV